MNPAQNVQPGRQPAQEADTLGSRLLDNSHPHLRTRPAFQALERVARSNAAVSTVALAVVLILGDFLTHATLAFALLYLVPLSLAAWWRGRALGIAVAVLCMCGTLAAQIAWHTQTGQPFHAWRMVWNDGGSFALFVIGAQVVARLREYADRDERARRLTVDQLRQAERLGVVGRLAAGVAHELGTPLNVIMGHAELLASDHPNATRVQAASAIILAQTEKMTAIIRGLLDFARRGATDRTAVDLAVVARDAAVLLRPTAHKKDIEIEVESEGDVVVQANRTEIEQVLVNLMMNGIQAMPTGGTLRVRAHPRLGRPGSTPPSSTACLEVEDEGVGISPESLPKVFDPFFTTKDVGEGTGLGLSVSYGIVSDHGGRIQVSSALGSGSRFSVYLPRAAVSS
jgi:signal transduction histidine kinase